MRAQGRLASGYLDSRLRFGFLRPSGALNSSVIGLFAPRTSPEWPLQPQQAPALLP